MTRDETLHSRRVVVGVDASGHAARAATWAAAEAQERGLPLHIIHALDSDPSSALYEPGVHAEHVHTAGEAGGKLLAQVAHHVLETHPQLEVTTELVRAGAAGALVTASGDADLVVVGTRGRGGFAGLPLGSVSARLVAHAHCATVVVRGYDHDDERTGEVVLGMQDDQADEAIRFAFEQAVRYGAALRAVHAWAPYPAHAQDYLSETDILARQAAERMIEQLKAMREKYPDVPVAISVQRGHPSAVLADASTSARLVVVGAHRRLAPLSLGVGPVIHGLLGHVHAPVAVVPIR
ncbi:universal stress protein [Actinocrinis puniceicyclus]|uniref:Universal stress protein n=1 Tax=Actinocrinis puniceicyclus TaxID=977794 RepID=A0A8J7WG12_9ACTN|nr:universal stress protein [Actinocrinis puniceicyclus]MBS2961516.1 universal stress protein [Actinocrinis puniceicyclus]